MTAVDQRPSPVTKAEAKDDAKVEVDGPTVKQQEDAGDPSSLESNNDEAVEESTKMTPRRFMACVAMSFSWQTGQLPPYLWGSIPPIIYGHIGGVDRWCWFISANLIGFAAICPFVGALSDLIGRRYVAILGSVLIIVGQIVCTTAHEMNPFIGGMALSGIGAGIGELTSIAGTAELAPTSQRGIYIAALIMTILPWTPAVLWGQLIAQNSNWRMVGVLIIVYTSVGLLVTIFFYFPPKRTNSANLAPKEIFHRVDVWGGLSSIASITLIDAAVLWGGYMYPWSDAHVVACLVLGIVTFIVFVCWEIWGAKYPMIPRNLGPAPKTLWLMLVISFISGANFFSVLLMYPTQAYNVWGHDPVEVGLRGLPFGLGVMVGCVITLGIMSWSRGRGIRWLLAGASAVMTAGCGALAAAERDSQAPLYPILLIAGLGVGGIVVPTSVITTIISPDEIIATITSLTVCIRVVGGAIGYAIYFNVLEHHAEPLLINNIATAMVVGGVTEPESIISAVELTAASLLDRILDLPGVDGNVELWESVVLAGQLAYAEAYKWVYYVSIAFGGASIIASFFVDDIAEFMDDHIAVVL